MSEELCRLPAVAAARRVRSGEVSPSDLVEAHLSRIARLNGRLQAYAAVLEETARREARAIEEGLARGERRGALSGAPFSVKDTIDVSGTPCRVGSVLRPARRSAADATVVARLRAAGGIVLGKAECAERGFLGRQPVRNPWRPDRSAGGSSGGSAAGVAAGMAAYSIGSDSAGSIRNPAALCGVVGLKPTFGRVPRDGFLPLAHSLDTPGIVARTAEDCAAVLDAVSDPGYAACLPELTESLRGRRIGVPRAFIDAVGPHSAVRGALEHALNVLTDLGLEPRVVEIAGLEYAPACAWTVLRAEAYALYARELREEPGHFSATAHDALAAGRVLTAEDYIRAQSARTWIARTIDRVWDEVELLVLPTRPDPDLAGGAPGAPDPAVKPAPSRGDGSFVTPFNLALGPAASVPSPLRSIGMPLAWQIAAPPGRDGRLLAVVHRYLEAVPAVSWPEALELS